MFVLSKKKTLFRSISIIGVLAATTASVFFALKNIETGVNAITGEGESVKITREWDGSVEHTIYYSSPDHNTVRFFIQNHAGEKIQAFCRNPNLAGPDRPDPTQPASSSDFMEIPATRMADNPKQNAIKLLAYLGTVDNSYTAAALNELFQDHPSAFPDQTSIRDERFGFLHAAMGYLEENGNLDFHELTEADKTFVKSIGDTASSWVTNDADIWALARPYQLFALDKTQFDTSVYQDIVWIEDASTFGNIEVKKCDKDSGCTPQGGASFQGVTVAVKNNGNKIYYNGNFYARGTTVATGTTDAGGKVTFSDLPAGSYIIEETAPNSSYQKDATSQTVTVSSGTTSVQLNDTVVKGNVKVVKHDADSNSCFSQGSASLSGTQFTIYNKTGRAIIYGGASKANGAAIDTKTIDGNCETLFTGLPYGDYSIKETRTGGGYSGNSTEQTFSISSNNQTITKTYTNSVVRGRIKVKKCDGEIGCAAQGAASLAGITFEVRNANSNAVYYGGHTYLNGAVITSDTTGSNGEVTFSGLPIGTYTITEKTSPTTNTSYVLVEQSKTGTVSSNGTSTVQFDNTVKMGSLVVTKKDYNSKTCSAQGSATLAGTTFTLYNNNGKSINYHGSTVANGAAVAAQTINATNCVATFFNIPYGEYILKETSVGIGYSRNTKSETVSINSNGQTIEKSFENQVIRGNIKVKKCDAETGACAAQGGASLSGIIFEVRNANDNSVYYGNTLYAKNAVITSSPTGANGEVTFNNLPVGKYTITEKTDTTNNTSYNLVEHSETVTISVSDTDREVQFNNTVVKGNLTVTKKDAETEGCSNLGKANFSTVRFKLVNKTGGDIVYDNQTIANNAEVDTKSLGGDCTATFSNLPYGNYTIQETTGGVGYQIVTSTPQNITINSANNVPFNFNNQVIRGDVRLRKMNDETNAPMANIPFRITSKTTGENHIVVTNSDGIINTSSSFIPHSTGTNGYDGYSESEIYSIVHKGYGTWFGKIRGSNTTVPVSNILGALPYDDYTIVELHCVKNEYCYEAAAPTEFTIDGSVALKDLGDWTNDCVTHEIDTTASDEADGDKYIEATSNVTIKDVIPYRAMIGKSYTIRGTVMDKSTGQPLLINGEIVENTTTVSPTDSEYNETTLTFNFDASDIAGKRLVVFERLFDNEMYDPEGDLDTIGENGLVVKHTDIEDDDQSLNVVYLDTTAMDDIDEDKYIKNISEAKIRDLVDYCARSGTNYTLVGVIMDKSTGAPLAVEGNTVTHEFTASNDSNCGQETLVFTIEASELAGKDLVVFERLYETAYYNPAGEPDTTGQNGLVTKHTNINDDNQSINVVSLDTTAMDDLDEDKFVKNDEEAKIRDIVDYCAKAGTRYLLKGTVMDKLTGEPLVINDSVVEETLEFTDETNCEQHIMTFTMDAREIAGRELVVFERLYEADKYVAPDEGEEGEGSEEGGEGEGGEGGEEGETEENDQEGKNGLVIKHTDINDDDQSVTIVSLDTVAADGKDDDKYVEAGKTTIIKDIVHYCVKPNTDFRILGYLADGETDEALSFDHKPIEQEVIVNSESGCGDVEMKYELDSTELVGRKIVVYNDLYINHHKVLAHESPYDKYQYVNIVSYFTYARNYRDQTKELPIEEDNIIEDLVKYCLAPGDRYILKGTLMDKSTGKEILINGKTVSVSQELIVPIGEPCGETVMHYPINTTELGGKEIVIFDEVYHEGELIVAHHSADNVDETVTVATPPPNTGIITKPVVGTTEETHNYLYLVMILPVLGVAGYIVRRVITKKKSISF